MGMAVAEQNLRDPAHTGQAAPTKGPAFRRTTRYFRRYGARETAKQIVFALLRLQVWPRYHALGHHFDEKNNVQTSGQTLLPDITTVDGASADQSLWYEPAPINVLADVLPHLEIEFRSFTFVDLGSGKGRIVLLASHFDFKKVVGVEFAQELHQHAIENLERYPRHKRKCHHVELLCVDVRNYDFPETDLVVFIFDSFKAELLRHVVERLKALYLACPRKIYLLYLNPGPRNQPIPIIEGSGFLYQKELFSFFEQAKYNRNSPFPIVVYETR
jgi:hypothetical protein